MRDCRTAVLAALLVVAQCSIASANPPPVSKLNATATAYCDRGITKDGTPVHEGIVAADPRVLPLGSVVHVHVPELSLSGVFTVRDTGSAVKGRIVDIFMWSCGRAKLFGRRSAVVSVITRGLPRPRTPR